VTQDGFEYAGTSYPSLTKIAKQITGAHWLGPRFFGLLSPDRLRAEGGELNRTKLSGDPKRFVARFTPESRLTRGWNRHSIRLMTSAKPVRLLSNRKDMKAG